jgi:hypothetical protein
MHETTSSNALSHEPRGPIFRSVLGGVVASILFMTSPESSGAALAQAPARKPNILVIMGDDVGWFNIGAYHRGIMSGKTPNLDKLAAEGMMFTDYYAEASCTAGGQISSLASCQSARVSPRLVRRGPMSASRTRR